ncbi:hypothetical protein N7504_011367 [Penicillium tannophilum]|nr:hypothetical protein N7504_011367 [Penicillium tannophilum]
MQQKLDTSIWQQPDALSILSNTQVITGIPVPQPENSQLLHGARFASLFTTSGRTAAGGGEGRSGIAAAASIQIPGSRSAACSDCGGSQ